MKILNYLINKIEFYKRRKFIKKMMPLKLKNMDYETFLKKLGGK